MDSVTKNRNWKICRSAWECSDCETVGRKTAWFKETNSDFKLAYLGLKKKQYKDNDDVKEVVKKKTSSPTLLPAELMQKVVDLVSALCLRGAPILSPVASGTIPAKDRLLLLKNGGHIDLNIDWSRQVLY